MPSILIICLLTIAAAIAQSPDQPVKEDTQDLRGQLLIFRIEEIKSGKVYQLLRNSLYDHYLKKVDGKDEELRKVDSRDAKKLDTTFASKFIRIQYEIPAAAGDCKVTLRLMMKGEEQEVCEKDEKKSQEVAAFVEELAQRF